MRNGLCGLSFQLLVGLALNKNVTHQITHPSCSEDIAAVPWGSQRRPGQSLRLIPTKLYLPFVSQEWEIHINRLAVRNLVK